MSPPGRENSTLELKIISANDVSHDLKAKMEVYAVVSITGDNTQRKQVAKTPIDFNGGSNPRWNHTVKFSVNEKAAGEGQLILTIKLFSHWLEEENDLYLGEVNVWVHELLGSTNENNNIGNSATYPIEIMECTKGMLNLSYWFKPVNDPYPPVQDYSPSVYLYQASTRSGQSIIYFPTKTKLTLELVIKFARNIKCVNIFNDMNVHASVMIREDNRLTKSKIKTPTVYTANKNPTWNHAVTFTVEEKLVREGRLNLVVALISVRPFLGDIEIGEVKVSIKELFVVYPPSPLVNGDDNGMSLVTENVIGSYGRRGTLSFMYRFKFKEEPADQPLMYLPVSKESSDHGTLNYMAAHPGFQVGPSSGVQPMYMQPQPHPSREYRPY